MFSVDVFWPWYNLMGPKAKCPRPHAIPCHAIASHATPWLARKPYAAGPRADEGTGGAHGTLVERHDPRAYHAFRHHIR